MSGVIYYLSTGNIFCSRIYFLVYFPTILFPPVSHCLTLSQCIKNVNKNRKMRRVFQSIQILSPTPTSNELFQLSTKDIRRVQGSNLAWPNYRNYRFCNKCVIVPSNVPCVLEVTCPSIFFRCDLNFSSNCFNGNMWRLFVRFYL